MPAKSKEQKHFFQLALGVKKGEIDKSEVTKDVVDAAQSMSKKDLEKFAKEPVEENKRLKIIRRLVREELNKIL